MFGLFDYTVYSFLDLSGAIAHPLVGSYSFVGQGVGQVEVVMSQDKTFHEMSVEGDLMIGKVAGRSGKLVIVCQQTSNVHKWLLFTYQKVETAEAKEWARMTAFLRNLDDKTSHTIRGLSFDKVPEKAYAAQGGMVSWTLMAAEIINVAPNPSGAGLLNALQKQFQAITG